MNHSITWFDVSHIKTRNHQVVIQIWNIFLSKTANIIVYKVPQIWTLNLWGPMSNYCRQERTLFEILFKYLQLATLHIKMSKVQLTAATGLVACDRNSLNNPATSHSSEKFSRFRISQWNSHAANASQDANFSTPAEKVGRSRRRRFRLQFGAVRIFKEVVGEILDSWRHSGNHEWCSRVMQPAVAFTHLGSAQLRNWARRRNRRPLRCRRRNALGPQIGAGCRQHTENLWMKSLALDADMGGTHHWTATFSHEINAIKFL